MSQTTTTAVRKADARSRKSLIRRIGAAPGVAPALMLAALILVWEFAVRIFPIPQFLLPSPTAVLEAGIENAALLWKHSVVTLTETLIGFALSAVVGILLAVIMVAWPAAGRALDPILVGSQVIP